MSHKSSGFVKQAAILAIAGILVRLLGFIYRVSLTGMIGDEGNGIYAAGYYLYTFFLIMSSAGLPAAISKMVSERYAREQYRNAHRIFRVALAIAAVGGLLCSLALWLGARWLSEAVSSPSSYYAILTLSPTVFIVAIMAVYRGYFQGMNTTVPTALSQVVEQIFNAIFSVFLCYVLMKQYSDIALGAAGGTAGTGVGAMCGLITIMAIYALLMPAIHHRMKVGHGSPVTQSRRVLAKELFSIATPIIIGTAVFSMTNLIDMKMVNSLLLKSGYSVREANSLYGMLSGKYATLTTLPVSISTALATAIIPAIAYSITLGQRQETNRKINTAFRMTMVLSIPAAVGLGVLANPILLLLYPAYSKGGYLLQLGSISIIFLAMAQIITGILQGAGYVKVPVIAALCGAVLKIPLNAVLIPIREIHIFGITIPINVGGAVLSTIVCYMVVVAIDLFVLLRMMGKGVKLDFTGAFLKPMVASLVMGASCYAAYTACMWVLPSNTVACLLAIGLGGMVYLGYMLLIRGILPEDLKFLNRKKV